jgi:hypothetical protein
MVTSISDTRRAAYTFFAIAAPLIQEAGSGDSQSLRSAGGYAGLCIDQIEIGVEAVKLPRPNPFCLSAQHGQSVLPALARPIIPEISKQHAYMTESLAPTPKLHHPTPVAAKWRSRGAPLCPEESTG